MIERIVPGLLLFAFILFAAIIAGRLLVRLLQRFLLSSESAFKQRLSTVLFGSKERVSYVQRQPASKWDFSSALYNLGVLSPPELNERSFLVKLTPVLLGIGLILMPYFENRIVEVISYVLIIGATLIALSCGMLSPGPKWLWIPLALITVSGIIFSESATGLLLVWMLGVYLVSNKMGTAVTKYFGLTTVVGCIGLIVYCAMRGFIKTGGLFSPVNYNIASAAILMGFLMWNSRHKWWLSALVVVALFFTGADEALLATGALFITLLIRKDWSKRLLLPIGALVLTVAICTPLGITHKIWTNSRLEASVNAIEKTQSPFLAAFGYRLEAYKKAYQGMSIAGHGYNPFDDRMMTIHNVPLRAGYELGAIAGIAWLVALVYGIKRTKAKYALVAIGVLSMVDHMFWTQIPAYYWVALGMVVLAPSDLMYKIEKARKNQ